MKTPRATYRLQFTKDFGFDAAARIAPYLARLGVSHVYASPYLKARPGSTHGYDIVAHDELNPELGGEPAFRRMLDAFAKHGLRHILDFVPNHMGVGGADNPLWLDVLEWGPQSRYSGWFDIDWEPDRRYLTEKLLVPVLGGQYGVELDNGKLVLKFDPEQGDFAVWAYETHKLPICPLAYERILGDAHPQLENLGDEFAALMEWRPQAALRASELKRELAQVIRYDDDARACLTASLARLNGAEGGRGELHALIQEQYWRAAHFRVAGDDINYRRFFNINDLAGLRVEVPEVFEHAHRLVFRLMREGALDGLRIDHVDGLLDPKGYLDRLRSNAFESAEGEPFYLIVEKILSRDETLPDDWPIEGTTGYEFANLVLRLLMDPAGEEGLTHGYVDFTGEQPALREIVRECKIRIMKYDMASELNVLARDAARVARQNTHTADFTRNILHAAIKELTACFPVYRTYLNANGELSEAAHEYLVHALARARRNKKEIDPSVFDFLENLLSGRLVARPRSGFSRQSVLRCAMKLQQYSGPVMAKGLEDTALYRYNRLAALNEVGGDPEAFSISVEEFHDANRARARRWPHAMLSTATHDTKRGEDTRARLAVLSQIPDEWLANVWAWSGVLRPDGRADCPDRNEEYLFYQLLLGGWPTELTDGEGTLREDGVARALEQYRERVKAVMIKSIREAKVHSTWAAPHEPYENGVLTFIDRAFASSEFLRAFLPCEARVARIAVSNSLVQTTLKLTAPGVPDVYQGAELWDLSFVDPDNRRPVDYDMRSRLLEDALQAWGDEPLATLRTRLDRWHDGSIKMLLLSLLMKLRREREELFTDGSYQPCDVSGGRICAFMRQRGEDAVLVVAACAHWLQGYDSRGTAACVPLPAEHQNREWRELFTNRHVAAAPQLEAGKLLDTLPVAVLTAS